VWGGIWAISLLLIPGVSSSTGNVGDPSDAAPASEGPRLVQLSGTVKDHTGTGVSGVRVQARNLSSSPETNTNAQGIYNLSLPQGIYNIVALPPDTANTYVPWHRYITLEASPMTLDPVLVPGPARGFTLSGTLRSSQSGSAIAGAQVELRDREFVYYARKTTGGAGDFSFSVPPGDFALDFAAAAHTSRRVEMRIAADATGLDVRLHPTALSSSIQGNVMETRQGGPAPSVDATVVITGPHGFRSEQRPDGGGNYNIPVPSNASFTVEVYNHSRLAKPRTASSGATNVDFLLPVDVSGPRVFAILNPGANASLANPVRITGQVNDSNGGAAGGRILVGEFLRSGGGVDEYALRKVFAGRTSSDLADTSSLALSRGADQNLSFSFDWDTWYRKGQFLDSVSSSFASGTLDHWTWGDLAVPAWFRATAGSMPIPSVALFRTDASGDAELDAVLVNRSGATWLATKTTQPLAGVAVTEFVQIVSQSTGDIQEVERPGQWMDINRVITMKPVPGCGRHMVAPVGWDYGSNVVNSVSPLHLDNCPPQAVIDGPSNVQPGQQFTLDGANSTDDTFITRHEWTINPGGFNHSGARWDHSIPAEGNYTVVLAVFDGAGNRGETSRPLTVSKIVDTVPPVAVANVPPMWRVSIVFDFDARKSTDDKGIAKWRWEWFLDKVPVNSSSKESDTTKLNTVGRYEFVLTVTDQAGNTDEDRSWIRIVEIEDDIPPDADAGGNRLLVEAASTPCPSGPRHVESGEVLFDGSNSTDQGGSRVKRWSWFLLQGNDLVRLSDNQTFTKRFEDPGRFNVTLEVEDGAFNLDSDTIEVVVLQYDSDGGIGDGLPDKWERTHFGDLRERPEGDPDGDGINNQGEMCGLTDPRHAEEHRPPPAAGILGVFGMIMPIIVIAVGAAIIALILRKLKQRGQGVELPPGG
jgi:hypothetical protein